MFGCHLSIAGGLHRALIQARRWRLDCLQIFTKNQRQWSCPPLTDTALELWRRYRQLSGLAQIVAHASYLVNLAGPDGPVRERSLRLFRDELERCQALEIPYLVVHPGSHMGAGEDQGLRQVVAALDQIYAQPPSLHTVTCLETTAGAGTTLGYRLEHLQWILEHVRRPDRLAVCIDTAHLLAAGYDLTSAEGMERVIQELDRQIGLDRVTVVHVNDSRSPRGSRVDRHAHIGQGCIARAAFVVLINHPRFCELPKILETPKATDARGRSWDLINLARLRRMRRSAG